MEEETRGDSNASQLNFPGKSDHNSKNYKRCIKYATTACNSDAYVKFMLNAMEKLGCKFEFDKHLVCEPCSEKVLGGFDPERKQVVMCDNNVSSQKLMNQTLTHELIHAYDICRVKYNKENLRHLACTEVRAANLSGDCFMSKEIARLKFGWKKHQQACVKERAVKSILCVKDITKEEAVNVVEGVFESCFKDTDPFDRIPP
eukprot:gene7400-8218_t